MRLETLDGYEFVMDPKSFVRRPARSASRPIETGILAMPPSYDFVRWLPELEIETGLVHSRKMWAIIKGTSYGIPRYLMPHESDILIHSHPRVPNENEDPGFLPSTRDFLNASQTSRNLVVSVQGITRFQPVTNERARGEIKAELEREHPRIRQDATLGEKIEYLREVGAVYELMPWEEISYDRFHELMVPKPILRRYQFPTIPFKLS